MTEPRFHVGQEVFVVHGHVNFQYEVCKVVKVGRKFGYLDSRTVRDVKFDLATGMSVHPDSDCNARANGRGFDVFLTKEAYQTSQHAKTEHERLAARLISRLGRLEPMSPQTVERIHKILDEEGLFAP